MVRPDFNEPPEMIRCMPNDRSRWNQPLSKWMVPGLLFGLGVGPLPLVLRVLFQSGGPTRFEWWAYGVTTALGLVALSIGIVRTVRMRNARR